MHIRNDLTYYQKSYNEKAFIVFYPNFTVDVEDWRFFDRMPWINNQSFGKFDHLLNNIGLI